MRIHRVCLLVGLCAGGLTAAELTVGPGGTYAQPSQAAAAARDGDTISIAAGLYRGDVCAWTASNLTIRGVGGFAHLDAAGRHHGGKGIWVVRGANTTIEGIEFSGAAVADRNGAGVRLEGPGLIVRGCWFHDNEDGILAGDDPVSDILIERCEFGHNGNGDGYSHNLYVNHVRSLTFRGNWSHHAKVGHNLKSRALTNTIIANRIMDGVDGTGSYAVDIPNGGLTFLIGNCIQQGPATQNAGIICYGEEGGGNPVQHLYVINNTIVNDRRSGIFLSFAATTTVAQIENNILLGPGTAFKGTPTSARCNLITAADPFIDRAGFDYHLRSGAAAIDAGCDPGLGDGQALLPVRQYVHPHADEARGLVGRAVDMGAYEWARPAPGGASPPIPAGP